MPQHIKIESNENNTEIVEEPSTSSFLADYDNSDDDDLNVAEIIESNKGGPKLIHCGYMYTLHKKQPYTIRWRCVGRTMNCRSSLITTTRFTKPRMRIEHNHEPDFAAAQVARKRYLTLRDQCVSTKVEGATVKFLNVPPRVIRQENNVPGKQEDRRPVRKAASIKENLPRKRKYDWREIGEFKRRTTRTNTTATTAGRLVLVACEDTVKLTARHLLQEQQRDRNRDAPVTTSSNEDIVEDIRFEETEMKQEPEDEEDYFLETVEKPSLSPTSSTSHHATAVHRVRSHARSLRAMTNPSAVWAHFDLCVNDPLRAQCRICGAVVVRGGANPRQCGTTNLHRHLRVHHGGRLIGTRYHVLQSPQSNSTGKTIRIAAQSLVRSRIRNIAPAPISQQQQQQQQQQQPKTLVLKTIPLKVKQVAPTTIKMPPRQTNQAVAHNIVHQQPTEVCLRWNSYHSNMQNSFPTLLDSEQFVDVTLACEGRSLKCHKMILSACSDYLADLLRENPCQHPIILMKDLKFWEVEALVKFMYRGEVNVAHDKLPQLLNAAEALQVKGLAGPNPSSQNPKPPLLIPQSKQVASQSVPRATTETKEKPSTSGVSTPSSPKRAQKRQHAELSEPKPFTKIRLQRPVTPTSPITTVKLEPLDIPLSPTEMFSENNENSSTPSNFEKLMSLHEDDDPGGNEAGDDGETEIKFDEIPEPPDINDSEDQMEFVPTDFLEQEQDIVEETEVTSNKDCKEDESTDYGFLELDETSGETRGSKKEQCSKEKRPV